jgi:hypothetical protein
MSRVGRLDARIDAAEHDVVVDGKQIRQAFKVGIDAANF